jgi:hypothetical protein
MAKTYREVLERYDRARAFGEKRSLSEYSAHLNRLTGTDLYSEGLRDGPWTRFSTRADQVLGDTLGQVTGPLGEVVGGLFGEQEAGRRVGEGLPRALLQTAPLYLLGPEAGIPATALALGGTGALFAGQTYADTGSAKAAALSGVTAAAMPAVGKYGGQLGAKVFGAPRIAGESAAQSGKYINSIIPTTGAQRGAQFAGSQLAQSVAQEASGYAQHKTLSPETPYDWLSADFLIGQIPFTVYDAVNMTKAPKLTLDQAQGLVKPKTVAPKPEAFKRSVEPSAEESLTTEAAIAAHLTIAKDDSIPLEKKNAALAAVVAAIHAPGTAKAVKEVQKAAVENVPEPEITLTGKAQPAGPGAWRVRVDAQDVMDQGDITGTTVFVNGVEPTIGPDGKAVFKVKPSQLGKATFQIAPDPLPDPNQLDLPVQQSPGDLPKRPGIGGGELQSYESPELQGQPWDDTPHVTETEGAALVAMGVPETRIPRLVNTLPKSQDLILDMFQGRVQEDAQGNIVRLGNTDVANAGWMNETRFLKTTQVPQDLMPAFREMYPEAFNEKGEVNATVLMKGLKERPMVEVKKLGSAEVNQSQEAARLRHDLDTRFPGWEARSPETGTEEARLVETLSTLEEGPTTTQIQEAGAQFSFLGPKSEQEMPGYVELLGKARGYKGAETHWGDEHKDTIFSVRGYEETLPDGRKVFHVIEIQSTTGQRQLANDKSWQKEGYKNEADAKAAGKPVEDLSHPLLSSYETLALKAAIQHARDIGADAVMLSDAETAMMTEGHDKQTKSVYRVTSPDGKTKDFPLMDKSTYDEIHKLEDQGWKGDRIDNVPDAPQSAGMRLHYDTTLPSALAKLTGQKGERVDVGLHEKSMGQDEGGDTGKFGSPVFKNPDGTPKSSITGRLFSLDKIQQGLSLDDTLSLKEAVMKYEQAKVREENARAKAVKVPEKPEEWVEVTKPDALHAIALPDNGNPLGLVPGFRKENGKVVAGKPGQTHLTMDVLYDSFFGDVPGFVTKDGTFLTREEAAAAVQKARVETELSRGATPTQAAETSRLLTQTPEVAAALKELEVHAEEARTIAEKVEKSADPTKLTYKEAERKGFERLSEYEKAPLDDKKARGVLHALKEFTTTGADRKNISLILAREVGRWDGESVDGLRAMFHDALYTKDGAKKVDVASRGEGIPGIETGRVGMSEAEAQKTWESLSKDMQSLWEVTKGKPGEWKVQQKVTGGETTSLDAPVGESGTGDRYEKIDAKVAEATPQMRNMDEPDMSHGSVTLPDETVQTMIESMAIWEKSPGSLNRALQEQKLTLAEWNTVKEAWMEDTYDGTEITHMKAANIVQALQRKPAPYALGSTIPFDEALVEATGVRRGGRAVVEWLSSQPDLGLTAQLVSKWKSFGTELDSMEFVTQGDPRWTPQFSFQNGDIMNLSWLPEGSTRVTWAREVAHEMAHFMERKLAGRNDPAAVEYRKTRAEILQTLRQSKQLPPKVRALLDKIIKNDDYNRYRTGTDVFGEWKAFLGNDLFRQYYDILYGLSDSRGYEMVANMFGHTQMQGFMANESVPRKAGAFKSVLNWFSDVYNKLVGGDVTTSNALAELLSSHDNYLTGGLLRNIYNGKDFIRDSLIRVQGVRPEALASRMQTVERTYAKGDLYGSIAGFVREGENGLLPVTAQYMQLDQPLRTALVSGDTKSVFQGTMSLLPEQLPVHQELFYRMQQDVALTKDLVKNVKEGKIQADLPPNTEANLKLASVKLNAMRRALKKQGLALERQADLANFTYEGLDSTIADQLVRPELPDPESQPPEMEQAQALMGMKRMAAPRDLGQVKTETSGQELEGKGLGFLEKTFALTQFFKKEHPEVRPLVGHVQDEHGKATQTATELNLVLNGRMDPVTGKWEVSQPVRKALEKVAGSPTLTSAFSDAIRLTAERAKQNRQWSWTDPEFAAILRPLNPQDRAAVQMVQTQFKLRHDHFVNSVIPEKFSELNHENTATVIQTLEGTILPEQAREMSKKVYDALQAMMDPARLPLGTALLQDVQRTLSPATFLKALEHANQSIADVNGFLDVARKNLDFVSEQRFDAHHLRMTGPKGEKHYSSAQDVKTLQARREDLERKGWKFEYYTPKADANSTVGGVNAEIMGKFKEMDTLAIQRLTSALSGRPDTATLLETVLPEVRRADEYAASAQAFKPVPGVTRDLVAGREYLNMIDNAHEFYGRGINWFKHKITRAKTNLDMMHPEIAGNRVLKDWSEQHVKNYLTQDNSVVRKFNEAVFYQRLALNFGNMMLESVQSLGTGMQALIAETGSVRDAVKLTALANKEYAQYLRTKKGSTPELDFLMRKSEATGASEPTLWDDTYDPNTNSVMSAAGAPGHPVKRGLNVVGALARKPSSALQKYNNNIALIASFKLGMEQGMTKEEAFNFARDVKERGTFTGGKPQRSVGLWSIKSRPVPQLMTSLTTYVQGWFNQMAQDYKIGFKGAGGSDLTAQQRSGSRKAFVYGLAAQAVLAGGLGLPGVGQGIALLNQATGLDLKGWLRQNLAKLFDEDEDSGGLLTNLALRGVAQAVSPIDPSNRAAIAVPFVGVDPYKGFSIAALAGAPGSSVEDFVKGLFALAQGDSVGYQKMLPSVLKGPAALVQGEGDVRDNRGGLLQSLSPAERWMTGLGLPSSRIQRARDTADTLKKQQAQAQREKERMVDELAKLVRSGNTTEVQRRMLELRKSDPALDLRSLAKSVANRVQAQTIPYDVRRDMNVGADMAGLQGRLPSTEGLRRQVSYDVESSLGFAPSFNPQADAQAAAVDRLLDSNPFLTRAEALRSVRGTSRVRRQIDPSWMQAFQ